MGTSIRPLLRMVPVRAKILVPLLFSVPMLAYQVAAVADDGVMLA
jgi:NDP-sugar pyrophosphorylase family protein